MGESPRTNHHSLITILAGIAGLLLGAALAFSYASHLIAKDEATSKQLLAVNAAQLGQCNQQMAEAEKVLAEQENQIEASRAAADSGADDLSAAQMMQSLEQGAGTRIACATYDPALGKCLKWQVLPPAGGEFSPQEQALIEQILKSLLVH